MSAFLLGRGPRRSGRELNVRVQQCREAAFSHLFERDKRFETLRAESEQHEIGA
jgi:hypothetical protein